MRARRVSFHAMALSRNNRRRCVVYPALFLAVGGFCAFMTSMPGRGFHGALPALDDSQRRTAVLVRRDVVALAGDIGERNLERPGTLDRAWQRVKVELDSAGYDAKSLTYSVDGHTVGNVEATLPGLSSHEVVVVGAHYDTASGAPGADDNASGVAVLLALARAFTHKAERRTIRFVAFVNEEPPHFWNPTMGSVHYARSCKEHGDEIVAMLSLESLGYFRDEPGSQKYPPVVSWFFPDRADFVGFVGNLSSRGLVRDAIGAFRSAASFPSEGAALPSAVTGVGWSDQWSFWQVGYPAIMVTDTAPFRNPNYHQGSDTPETLDYDRIARIVSGLVSVVSRLAR